MYYFHSRKHSWGGDDGCDVCIIFIVGSICGGGDDGTDVCIVFIVGRDLKSCRPFLCFIKTTVLYSGFQLEKLISKNYFLHKSAQEAYKSYVRSYASHSLKNIYDVNTLDLNKVALSFGFQVPPYVHLGILWKIMSIVYLVIIRCFLFGIVV